MTDVSDDDTPEDTPVEPGLWKAALVCAEVAANDDPILLAVRDQPIGEDDSGWQFLCGREHAETDEAHVWALQEVLELEPSLAPHLELRPGTLLSREEVDEPWMVVGAADSD